MAVVGGIFLEGWQLHWGREKKKEEKAAGKKEGENGTERRDIFEVRFLA